MDKATVIYRSYLLRVWLAADARWRATLEDVRTGERRAFATLALLLAFLENVSESQRQGLSQPIPANDLESLSPSTAPGGDQDDSAQDSRGL
jgi:hypothetical protein